MKSSFTVGYRLHKRRVIVYGVTSIVPNLNGFLFFTEDGQNHQIESHELNDEGVYGVYFEYTSEEDMKIDLESAQDEPDKFLIIDHRRK